MNLFNIERCFKEKQKRGWTRIYVCIDVHDTILEGKYNLFNEGASYMPNALNVLRQWTKREDICLILWSSSHIGPISKVYDGLLKEGVKFDYINSNPECPNTELCDFSKKPYFNILLDDKAGFVGNDGNGGGDWLLIEKELKRIGEWKEL
jgi:hypothetical protein